MYQIEPIGFVTAPRRHAEDDYWGGELAAIRLAAPYGAEALRGLCDFSHVEVLYLFHAVSDSDVVRGARHPRGNPEWPQVGIFAQRARSRPNRLGSTICRLLSVDGDALTVAELDAIDGTPVIDIKPVMQQFLPREPVNQPRWSDELMHHYWLRRQ